MKSFNIIIDMHANIGGEVKEIKEQFGYGNRECAIAFAMGYAEAMNWACPTIHEYSFRTGYVWYDRNDKAIIKVIDQDGNILQPIND